MERYNVLCNGDVIYSTYSRRIAEDYCIKKSKDASLNEDLFGDLHYVRPRYYSVVCEDISLNWYERLKLFFIGE